MKQSRIMVGDFETTVYKDQTFTEVWASALVEVGTEDVQVFNSLDATYDFIKGEKTDFIIYYHNLKFDGTFWLSFLFSKGYKNALDLNGHWIKDKMMRANDVKYAISDRGAWYYIKFKIGSRMIELRDSLKLLPFSVKRIGESFKTKHKKLDIQYEGYRAAGGVITDEERAYIKNDVLVVSEALQIMFKEGHNRLTIGACCLSEYKKKYDRQDFRTFFPDLNKDELTSVWEIPIYDD